MSTAGPACRRPVVSLLTDFGHREPFVGLMKGRLLEACPEVAIVDLTHELPPYAIEVAAFWIARSYVWFPAGSVHVCVVDPGVGTNRRILVLEHAGHCFLAPDNGLLGRIGRHPGSVMRAVDPVSLDALGPGEPSATFHGRDLFAPLAGRLAAGVSRPRDLGPVVDDWQRGAEGLPTERDGVMLGRVMLVDRFGNLFIDIDAVSLAKHDDWEVRIEGRKLPWVRTYGEAASGSLVALVNSFGVVEIARTGASAAESLGAGVGTAVELVRLRPGPSSMDG